MVVRLDVEWKPHMEPSLSSRLATLQTYIDCKCLIIHLFLLIDAFPDSLKSFLIDPNFTIVGIEVGVDIAKRADITFMWQLLYRLFHHTSDSNSAALLWFDTGNA